LSLLETSGICSGYGRVEILHNVSIRLEPGEVVSLIGPNGAGKSTLLKTVFGLLTPTSGGVFLGGAEITGMRPDRIVRLGMCYVPQTDNTFPSLTVLENLEMGAYARSDDYSATLQEIYEMLPTLREKRKQRVRNLSGGERQMVALGRALMLEPRVVLLDEPSAGLAPKVANEIFQKILHIKNTGVAVLIVEQNVMGALEVSDRAYVLSMGETRYEDTGRNILSNPEIRTLYLGG
jgi:ABC-type branched-subunit amino acid transport system ATPase component